MDWQGLSFFTTSATVGIATLVNVWIGVRASNRLVHAEDARLEIEKHRHGAELERVARETSNAAALDKNALVLEKIEQHVNGLNEKIAQGAFAVGKEAGIKEERATPMVPADKQEGNT